MQNSPDSSARGSLYASAYETIITSQLFGEDEKSPIQVDYSAVELGDPCHGNQPFSESECQSLQRFMSYEGKSGYSLAAVKPNRNKLEVCPSDGSSSSDFLVFQRTVSGHHKQCLYALDPFKPYYLGANEEEKQQFFGEGEEGRGAAFPKHTDGKSKQAHDEYHEHYVPCIGILDATDRGINRQQSLDNRMQMHLKKVKPSEQIFFTIRRLDVSGHEIFHSNVRPEDIANFLANNKSDGSMFGGLF